MSKVKVPAVFDKWYKQLKRLENKVKFNDAKDAAIFLISAQGHGYSAAEKNNVLQIDLGLTGYEENEMLYYISSNKVEAIRAILDGYEVEEQLYYIKIPYLDEPFVNYNPSTKNFFANDSIEIDPYKTKFTMKFIEGNLPEFKRYAVKAEE